jgi:hypothetical protein
MRAAAPRFAGRCCTWWFVVVRAQCLRLGCMLCSNQTTYHVCGSQDELSDNPSWRFDMSMLPELI